MLKEAVFPNPEKTGTFMLEIQKPEIIFEFNWYKLKYGEIPIDGVDMQFHGTFGRVEAPMESPVDGPTQPRPFDEPDVFGFGDVLVG